MQRYMKVIITCMMAAVILLVGTGCGKDSGKVSVKTEAVSKKSLKTKVDIAGALVPSQTVNISTKIGGQVKSIKAEVGKKVTAGETLINLDTKELNAQLQQAQAAYRTVADQSAQAKVNLDAAKSALGTTQSQVDDQITQAKINMDAAQNNLNRIQSLFDSGAISKAQLDAAQTGYDTTKNQYEAALGSSKNSQITAAQSKYDVSKKQYEISSSSALEQVQASVNVVEVQLSNANITTPINGTIVNKNISLGEIASPGATLLTVADTNTLKLKGTIPQEVLPFVKTGQYINILVDIYPGKSFSGAITSIGPIAASTGEYFPIEVSIANTGDLTAGLSAHASIDIDLEGLIAVPSSAVVKNNGENYLFTIKDDIAHKKIVKLGLSNDKNVVILSGVDIDEKIAISNANNLFDGMPVSIKTN